MYYNIKIKAQKGEFILESNDKKVTQREMDIYFAHIFDVSNEFKSKIKKVEIVNDNVKSINEIDALSKKYENLKNTPANEIKEIYNEKIKINGQNETPLIMQENTQNEVIQDIEPTKNKEIKLEPIQNQINSKPSEVITFVSKESNENVVQENIPKEAIQNRNLDNLIAQAQEIIAPSENIKEASAQELVIPNEDIKENNTQENLNEANNLTEINTETDIQLDKEPVEISQYEEKLEEDELPSYDIENDIQKSLENEIQRKLEEQNISINSAKNEIDDIIKAAQKEMETIDLSKEASNDVFEIINKDNTKKEDEENEDNESNIVNFDIDLEKDIDPKEDFLKEQEQFNIENQEKLNDLFLEDDGSVEKTAEALTKQINQMEKAEQINIDQINQNLLQHQEPEISNPSIIDVRNNNFNLAANTEVQSIKPQIEKQEIKQKPMQMNFNNYLANFNAPELVDEFLICAYYIKNMLSENSFTMKTLNSKLFPATGKIADMSIVNDLVSKGYITSTQNEGHFEYSISNVGEDYFETKYMN